MRKLLIIIMIVLLSGCSYKDEYGIDTRNYENIIHCEVTNYESGYSNTVIEQLYGNEGVVEYLYSEQFVIFEDKSVLENTKNSKENTLDGFSITVNVDKKNGAISTVTRIDYEKVDYTALLINLTGEEYSKEEADEQKKLATNMGAVDMTYCNIVK